MIGTIIGASLARPRYKITVSTGEYYVRCGADLLLNGMKSNLEAKGRCPICETHFQFRIKQRQVLRLIPVTSILHVVETMADGKPCIERERSPMFDREDCLHVWIDKYRGKPGSIFKPQAFLDHLIARRDPNSGQALSGYTQEWQECHGQV